MPVTCAACGAVYIMSTVAPETSRPSADVDFDEINSVIDEMSSWTSSGLGGQTAMALDKWTERLRRAVVSGPTPKERE